MHSEISLKAFPPTVVFFSISLTSRCGPLTKYPKTPCTGIVLFWLLHVYVALSLSLLKTHLLGVLFIILYAISSLVTHSPDTQCFSSTCFWLKGTQSQLRIEQEKGYKVRDGMFYSGQWVICCGGRIGWTVRDGKTWVEWSASSSLIHHMVLLRVPLYFSPH